MSDRKKTYVTRKAQVTEPNIVAEAVLVDNNSDNGSSVLSSSISVGLDILHICLFLLTLDNPGDEKNLIYEFSPDDFSELVGLKYRKDGFSKLKNDSILFFSKGINLSFPTIDENGNAQIIWLFEYVKFKDADRTIEVKYTEEGKKFLVDELKQRGRKIYFLLTDTLSMKSGYSKKLYPILLENIHRNTIKPNLPGGTVDRNEEFSSIFRLEDFQKMMQFPPGYYRVSSLKRICDNISEEITSHTPYDCTVTYNHKKYARGQKLTHVCWLLKPKNIPAKNDNSSNINSGSSSQDEEHLKWWMDLTHLDRYSAVINLQQAKKYRRDKAFLEKAYEKCLEDGADDLGRLLTYLIKNGLPEKTELLPSPTYSSKNNLFVDNCPKNPLNDYEAQAYAEEMHKVLFGFDD